MPRTPPCNSTHSTLQCHSPPPPCNASLRLFLPAMPRTNPRTNPRTPPPCNASLRLCLPAMPPTAPSRRIERLADVANAMPTMTGRKAKEGVSLSAGATRGGGALTYAHIIYICGGGGGLMLGAVRPCGVPAGVFFPRAKSYHFRPQGVGLRGRVRLRRRAGGRGARLRGLWWRGL